jgi:hypothetical protein
MPDRSLAQNDMECGGAPPPFRREARFACSKCSVGSQPNEARERESGATLRTNLAATREVFL